MAAELAAPLVNYGVQEAQKFARNPWDYIADLLIEIGSILLLVGIALGFVGFYLKAYSVKAKGDAAQGIVNIESVFGNVSFDSSQQPYLSVTTPNVANDISNLGNDAWRALSNTANQAWADLKGVATAIGDIPKALVQMVSQGPGIAINGFLGLVAEAFADIFILIFPYAILFGAAMLSTGVAMRGIRYVYDAYVKPEAIAWADRNIGAPLQDWLHRLLGNPSPPTLQAGRPAEVSRTQPARVEEAVAPVSEPSPEPPPVVPAETSVVSPPLLDPVPPAETLVAVPTTQQEVDAGGALQEAKDRMRAALRRKRDATPPVTPPEDYVGWAYAQIPVAA